MSSATKWTARSLWAVLSLAAWSWTGAAQASQGPGTSLGTATHLTQLTMAVLVYGLSALVVGAGVVGAMRRH